jgi:hypothetical protein
LWYQYCFEHSEYPKKGHKVLLTKHCAKIDM